MLHRLVNNIVSVLTILCSRRGTPDVVTGTILKLQIASIQLFTARPMETQSLKLSVVLV
jgi:hypothetical protein